MNISERIQAAKFWAIMLKIERVIMVAATASVVTTLVFVVLGRHIFHYNFLGYTEILVLSAFWMYFIGASYGSWEESHITADIMSQFVGERAKILLSIVSKTIQVILGLPMTYLSFEMLLFDIKTQQVTVDLEIPLLLNHAPIFIGFALMTFYALVYVVRDIYRLKDFDIKAKELNS